MKQESYDNTQFLQILEELKYDGQTLLVNDVADFLQCGYHFMLKYLAHDKWIVKLRHKANANILSLTWSPSLYTIRKNSTLRKSVPLSDILVSN